MLSSSGTEDDSSEETDYDEKIDSKTDRVKGENLKNFKQKQNSSKFKPLGIETEQPRSPKATEEPEEMEEAEVEQEPKEQVDTNEKQATGIAAAGFKKFVKKSISIKIKGSETAGADGVSESSITAETRLLKENKHISKKRSNLNIDIKKPEQDGKDTSDMTDLDKQNRKYSYLSIYRIFILIICISNKR